MKISKLRKHSLQFRISSIYLLASLIVLLGNLLLLFGINSMSNRMDKVYQDNLRLNELSDALDAVQDNMTNYLKVKTTDALENYYRSEQSYHELVDGLNVRITGNALERLERNIYHMSQDYLETVENAIEAKRGRNVEKYRLHYENATTMYEYINTYISNLNMAKFKENSAQYSELLARFRLLETTSLIVMLMVMVSTIGFMISFVSSALQPLQNLAQSANEVTNGNFAVTLPYVETEDEIGVVTNAFGQMIRSIERYIEQLRTNMEEQRLHKERELLMEGHLKDARLKYLQAQINPHFLFNTLNAGAQLAMMEGADKTYDYVQKVAQFYRYNMKKSEEIVTIRNELEMVDSYIYILNVRFAGEIHFEKKIDETLLEVEMPGMILQPIVENCVNHGIREMSGEGRILITLQRVEEYACISVYDNGIGMDQGTIDKIVHGVGREEGKTGDSNGIGMDNVISRMRLFTGNENAMELVSEGKGRGTTVFLYLQRKEAVEDV